jgi:predicted transposase YdaD
MDKNGLLVLCLGEVRNITDRGPAQKDEIGRDKGQNTGAEKGYDAGKKSDKPVDIHRISTHYLPF